MPFNIKDPKSVFPDNAAMQALAQFVIRDDVQSLAAALARDPSAVDRVGVEGVTLLMVAVVHSSQNSIRVLMKAGANPHKPASSLSNLGRPASMALRMRSKPDVFAILVSEGMDLNGGFQGDGELLLDIAVLESDDVRLRQILTTGRANPNIGNSVQNTPFLKSIASRQYEKSLLLMDAGVDPLMGNENPLQMILKRHQNWDPGSPKLAAVKQLEARLRAMGVTETSSVKRAPVRPDNPNPRN